MLNTATGVASDSRFESDPVAKTQASFDCASTFREGVVSKVRKTRSDKGRRRKICDCETYDYCRLHGSKP